MAKSWSEVAADPEFQKLSPSEKEAARVQYFDQVVAPNVPEDKRAEVRTQFDADTGQSGFSKFMQGQTKNGSRDEFKGDRGGIPGASIANIALSPFRNVAADLAAITPGVRKPGESFLEARQRAVDATTIPETRADKFAERLVGMPGEIVGSVAGRISDKSFGPEFTQAAKPYAVAAMDVLGLGGLVKGARSVNSLRLTPEAMARADESQRLAEAAKADSLRARAAEVVSRRFGQDVEGGGPTAQEAIERINKARAAGRPLALMDLGTENIEGLAGNVSRQPGPARNMLKVVTDERARGASQRLENVVNQSVSTGSMRQTVKSLLQERSKAAHPHYEAMENLQGIWSPRLQAFIDEPEIRKGLARGYKLERLDALSEGRKFDPTQLGIDLDSEGNIVIKKTPNMRVLDMGKRGLDAMIADERDETTGKLSALGRSLEKVRQSYLGEIDRLDTGGIYKTAREAWGGPSASLDAIKAGRSIFKMHPEDITEEFGRLSENNKQFFRMGAADALRDAIAEKGVTAPQIRDLARDSRNNLIKDKIRPLFKGQAEFDNFIDAVTDERAIFETPNRVMKGSQTAARMVEDQSSELTAGLNALKGAGHLAHGNMLGAVHNFLKAKRDLGLRPNPALNLEIARFLTDPNVYLNPSPTGPTFLAPRLPPPSNNLLSSVPGQSGPTP